MKDKKGGYGIVYQEVMRNKNISPEAKAIYAYLSSIAGLGQTCYPSIDTMSIELVMSKNRLSKYMNELIACGVVEKIREKSGNLYGRNVYKVTHVAKVQEDMKRIFRGIENRGIENGEVENRDTENLTTNNNNTNNNKLNNNIKNNNTSKKIKAGETQTENGFNQFWEAYPKKVGKGEAYKKYKARINSGWKPEELLEAARNYASKIARERTENQYIKHPKTFLSDTEPFTDFLSKREDVKPASNNDDDPYADWR